MALGYTWLIPRLKQELEKVNLEYFVIAESKETTEIHQGQNPEYNVNRSLPAKAGMDVRTSRK